MNYELMAFWNRLTLDEQKMVLRKCKELTEKVKEKIKKRKENQNEEI